MFGDWRPVRGREGVRMAMPRRATPAGTGIPQTSLQQTVLARQQATAAKFFTSSMPIETVQAQGLRPGSPVSVMNSMHFAGVSGTPGLGGVGQLSAIGCREVEPLLQELRNILDTAGSKLTAASRASAEAVYSDINSYGLYIPFLGKDCDKHVAELSSTIASLRGELGASAPAPLRPNADTDVKPMDPVVKFAIIGGGVLVGIVGLAVLTGNVASIAKVFR